MVARAASDDVDVLDAGEHLCRLRTERVGNDLAALDAPVEGVGQSAGLLEDLLQHEVPVGALLRRVRAPLRLVDFAFYGLAVRTEDVHLAARDLRDVALLEIDEALCHRQQRGHSACDEVLPDAEPDDQRARDAADDKSLRILRIDDQQRERAGEAGNRLLHRLGKPEPLLQVVVHEMRRDLGVGLRRELVTFRLQLVLDLLVVLDDAVMDDRDAIAGHVWVRVRLGHPAVRCPARVRDAQQSL